MAAQLAAMMAVQAIGGLYSGYQQKKGMQQEADDLENSIPELLYRQRVNEDALTRQSQSLYGQQVSAVASSGALVNTGSPLAIYAQSLQDSAIQKMNSRRETDVQVATMRTTAKRTRKQAKKVMLASVLGASGQAAGSLYQHNLATSPKGAPPPPKEDEIV